MRRSVQLFLFVLLLASLAWAGPAVDYTITLASPREHLVHVRMHLLAMSGEQRVQLPVWNALYQVRDFAQNVRGVHARSPQGSELPIEKLDKSTWRIPGAPHGSDVEYDVYLDQPGPFGAQLNSEHAFLNLAMLLMYPTEGRKWPVTVSFLEIPSGWRIATALARSSPESRSSFSAPNYDRLVDSPVEIGALREASFEQDGAVYRIAIHANPADYNQEALVSTVRKIVGAAVGWMNDRPFAEYLFIYHFPHLPGGGGMEHAYSTAIDVSAERLADDPDYFAQVTAHEFFHLWNVKRIRPATLEPVDYTRENYTRALWFCEGVTTTASTLMLVRAGLMNERAFLAELEQEIRALELRPARHLQSAEEASLDAWLEKYPQYRLPVRSISYYNKGEVLGFLLDLEMRRASNGSKSLRDLFRWMNENYARRERYFNDSDGVREAAEVLTGSDFRPFFRAYVAGVQELPYDEELATVGLKLQRTNRISATTGFESVRNFDSAPVVVSVVEGSDAAKAGLTAGDSILEVNGRQAAAEVEEMLAGKQPGDNIKLRLQGRSGVRDVKIKLGARREQDFKIVDLDNVTPAQRARRAAWLASEPEPAAAAADK